MRGGACRAECPDFTVRLKRDAERLKNVSDRCLTPERIKTHRAKMGKRIPVVTYEGMRPLIDNVEDDCSPIRKAKWRADLQGGVAVQGAYRPAIICEVVAKPRAIESHGWMMFPVKLMFVFEQNISKSSTRLVAQEIGNPVYDCALSPMCS